MNAPWSIAALKNGSLLILLPETFHTHKSFFKLIIGCTIRTAHIPCTCHAKRATGYDGNLFLEKQLLGELIIGQTRLRDRWKGVEGSTRLTAGQANAIEAINEHAAAACICLMHHLHVIFTMTQRLQRRLLCGGASAHNRVLVDLQHRL